MKKLKTFLSCIFILALCLCCISCGRGQTDENLFVFLSVRLKGNGDGTITAVAQNEFAIGASVLPIELTLYFSDAPKSDVADMTQIDSRSSDDLNIFKSIRITEKVEREGYYCATVGYSLRGETKYIQSEMLYYGTDGNRKSDSAT